VFVLCVLCRLAAVQSELTLVQTQQREQAAKQDELAQQVGVQVRLACIWARHAVNTPARRTATHTGASVERV
jgi:hypothetical protein